MCTVPSSDRRHRFLQYNFMDPGWGGAEFPCPPFAPALMIRVGLGRIRVGVGLGLKLGLALASFIRVITVHKCQ